MFFSCCSYFLYVLILAKTERYGFPPYLSVLPECDHLCDKHSNHLRFVLFFPCVNVCVKLSVDQTTSANQRGQAPPPEAVQGLLVVLGGHGLCC